MDDQPTAPSTGVGRSGRTVRRGRTARTRILGWYVLLLAMSLAAALLVQRAFLLDRVVRDTDEALDQEVEELSRLAGGTDPATGEAFGADVRAIFDVFLRRNVGVGGEGIVTYIDGEPSLADIPGSEWSEIGLFDAWAETIVPVREQVETADGPVRFVAVPLSSEGTTAGVFIVGVAMANRLARVDDAVRLAALIHGSIFMIGSLVAWLAAGQVLRPLRDLRRATETISESELATRIAVEGDDEIAQLAATFNRMVDRLQEAFAQQRRFVDDAGHELRTPITIIRGQLDVLGDDPGERAAAMALVDDELDRMGRIVNDLLVLAREQQPDFVMLEPVDLDALVVDLAERGRAVGADVGEVAVPPPVVVMADEQRLTQAMGNLVRNVVEHCPSGTTVDVGAETGPDGIVLWVHDDGPGIANEEQEVVFDRFGRAGAPRRSTSGAGLGLAIVAAVARGHGGRVTLDSEPGATTFRILLPPDLLAEGSDVGVEFQVERVDDRQPLPEDATT